MPITSGTRIGPYEVASLLGVGGMGEVYRSRDSKLGREVALKVLPATVAADPDRLARFGREAKLLASLNHPNIAAIYGLEDSGSAYALVMELVEGPTLADRITSGPMPSEEVLPIAKQICEALEYAHERGIVHRDLKPANIKVTPEGTVKVLDFGLAKALENEATPVDIASSPTMSRLATQAGMILGTAAYMSPEQARGKRADGRGFDSRNNHFNDNRSSLELRVRRNVDIGPAFDRDPAPRIRRLVSNITVHQSPDPDEYAVKSSILLLHSRFDDLGYNALSGRRYDVIKRTTEGLRLAHRTIHLDQSLLGAPY